ncbi:hypothetical protein [Pseudotamlana agarivorans]|uniref:hypothetical protein n=1 Tax=Pseudotamlana agarivorans TaxID=481183 RepID=UPI00082EEBD4|nr:hypothetical protein [Tamlana agarivorans]
MKTETLKNITLQTFNNIPLEQIIYTEIADSGAMGNAGGILLYTLESEKLCCYQTNMFEDEKLYLKIREVLTRHQTAIKIEGIEIVKDMFNYYYAGFGNHVFINKSFSVRKKEDYLMVNGMYKVTSSVKGVFESISTEMEQFKS